MLPVVQGVAETTRSIILYTVLLLAITTLFFTTEAVGWVYLGGATGAGLIFLLLALRLGRSSSLRHARHLYLYSLLYLAGLFSLVILDSTLGL
jgi:protoheme IX farnesyltransferase